MFKVNNINGDYFETTSKAKSVLGTALHKAMEAYFGGGGHSTPADDGEAIMYAHQVGLDFLNAYSDGLIEWDNIVPNRAKFQERYAFCFFGYIKELGYGTEIKEILMVEKTLKYKVEVEGKVLPVPLKGIPDLVYRDAEGRIKIRDHKFTGKHSAEDDIDPAKLIQAAFNYFLVYAELGEPPYSIMFSEYKTTENQDKTKRQCQNYEMIYGETPLLFEFFYRMYEDITDALLGKQVYVPNFNAFYDKEVGILAYIHKLDVDSVRDAEFKKMNVDNITDFLKKKIQKKGAMKKYLDAVATKFVSASTLNYENMTMQEQIKAKLAEHGLGVEYHSMVVGSAITLYCYEPSVGLKMGKIASFVKDIELATKTSGIRILAPIADSGLIGFEIPNKVRTFPTEIPKSEGFNLAIGIDIMGQVVRMDIREAPHVLVAGSSGSGKSVFLHSIIRQLMAVDGVELHLFDPKRVELKEYEGRVAEYQSNHRDITISLSMIEKEMEKRYELMEKMKIKNISEAADIPYKFVIIDEYADLALKEQTGQYVQSLAQKGRACGIHVIIATQRASTKIISGDIKVNFPTKVVLKMSKEVDSRVMLDEEGAEKLLGKGDLLFVDESGKTQRLQGFGIK